MKKMNKIHDLYSYNVSFSLSDDCYISKCLELNGIIAHGDTHEDAIVQAKIAASNAIEWMNENGEKPPEPIIKRRYSGKLSLRIGESLHRDVTEKAMQEGISLNQYIMRKIAI